MKKEGITKEKADEEMKSWKNLRKVGWILDLLNDTIKRAQGEIIIKINVSLTTKNSIWMAKKMETNLIN